MLLPISRALCRDAPTLKVIKEINSSFSWYLNKNGRTVVLPLGF
jgi:hypothetical protein